MTKPTAAAKRTAAQAAVFSYLNAHWAMEPSAHAALMQQLHVLAADPSPVAFLWDDDEADWAMPGKGAPLYQMAGGVAMLSLTGVLQRREDWFTRLLPEEFTSTERFAAGVQAAYIDPKVTGLLIAVDSPGGLAEGTAAAGEAVYQARLAGKKPVWAVATGLCCSAAYWVASQAEELHGSEDGLLGSIGTRWRLIDSSEFYEQMGLRPIEVTTGAYKAAGADGVPIGQDAVAYYQGLVDQLQIRFNQAVARGRKLPIDRVRSLAAEARLYVGRDALAEGLIDGIATQSELLARLQKQVAGNSRGGTRATSAALGGTEESLVMRWFGLGGRSNDQGAGSATPAAGAASQPGAAQSGEWNGMIIGTGPDGQPVAGMVEPSDLGPQFAALQAQVTTQQGQITALQGQVTTLTTERDTAQQEVARLTDGLREQYRQRCVIARVPVVEAVVAKMTAAELQDAIAALGTHAKARYGMGDTRPAQRRSQPQNPEAGVGEGPAADPEEARAQLDAEVNSAVDMAFGAKKGS